jgi:hypothetical protein
MFHAYTPSFISHLRAMAAAPKNNKAARKKDSGGGCLDARIPPAS